MVNLMKRLILLAGLALVALGQQSLSPQTAGGDLTAKHISSDGGGHIQMSGNVVITTGAMVLCADAAEYDQNTQQIRASGNVLVRLK